MASVPAVHPNTTSAQGAATGQPAFFPGTGGPAEALAAIRLARTAALSDLAYRIYTAAVAEYGFHHTLLALDDLAALGGIDTQGARRPVGQICDAGLLARQRALVRHHGKSVVRQRFRLVPPGGAQ